MISYTDVNDKNAVALHSASQVMTYGNLERHVAVAAASLRSALSETKTEAAQHILIIVDHSIRSVVWLLPATVVGLAIPVTSRNCPKGSCRTS